MLIKHAFVSQKQDGQDTGLVRPSDWNADHIIIEENNVTKKQFASRDLTDQYSVLYTVPQDILSTVLAIDVCNTSDAPRSIWMHFVPSDGVVGKENAIFWELAINPHETMTWTGPQTLKDAGSLISAKADTIGITVTISGTEES